MATYYVTQAGAGSANGSTLGNAWSAANFNTAGNWSSTPGTSGKISPADTASINGSITSPLVTQGAGLSGQVITVLFAAGAKFTGSGWTGSAITVNHNFITVDGGTNGLIENLNNGSVLTFQSDSKGVYVNSAHDVTVQNLTISPMYIRSVDTDLNQYGAGIFFDASASNCNNSAALNNVIDNSFFAIFVNHGANASGVLFQGNTASHNNWSYVVGDRGNTGDSITGVVIKNNACSLWSNWDEPATNINHHDGVFLFCNNSSGTQDGTIVDGNFFGAGLGTYITGTIYANAGLKNFTVCNNIFAPGNGDSNSNGAIAIGGLYYATTINVCNNTFVQTGSGGPCVRVDATYLATSNAHTFNIRNNVWAGPWYTHITYIGNGVTTLNSNHNVFYDSGSTIYFDVGGGRDPLSVWQSYGSGFDNDAVTTDPKLNATTYVPAVGSSAIGAGVNLTGLGITGLNSDKAGNARPAVAAWDDGAYNYVSTTQSGRTFSGKLTLSGKVS